MSDCTCPFCKAGIPLSKKPTPILNDYFYQKEVIKKLLDKRSENFVIDSMPDMILGGRAYDFKTEQERDSRRKTNTGFSLLVAGAGAGVYDQFVSRRVYLDAEGSYYKPVIWDLRPNPTLVDMEPLYLVPDLYSSTTLYRPLVDGLQYLQGDLWSIWMLTSKLPEDRFASYKRMYSLWSERFASYYMPMEMEVRSFGNGLGSLQILGRSLGKTETNQQVKALSKSVLELAYGSIVDEAHYLKGSVRNVEETDKPFYQKLNDNSKAQNRFGNSFKP